MDGIKPKIAMVTNWDNYCFDYEHIVIPNRRAYAKLHGYPLYEGHFAGMWGKVEAILAAWDTADYLWYLDFDAIIMDNKSIDWMADEDKFLISCDSSGPQAGSMFIPANQKFKDIFEEVWEKKDLFENSPYLDQTSLATFLWRVRDDVKVVNSSVFNSNATHFQISKFHHLWEPGDLVIHTPGMNARDRVYYLNKYAKLKEKNDKTLQIK